MNRFNPFMRNYAFMIVLSAILLACRSTVPPPGPGENGLDMQSTAMLNTPVGSTSPPIQPATEKIEIVELDPCKLVTKDMAEIVLGQSVDQPILAQDATVSSCTYIAVPGEKFTTITVRAGEDARNYLLNEIAQLQDGCQLRFSTSEGEGQPTPLPPAVAAMQDDPLIDLFLKDLEEQERCGMGPYSQVSELGDNAYTFMSFIQGAIIGVATQDVFVTFLVTDAQMSKEQALQAATELVRLSAAK